MVAMAQGKKPTTPEGRLAHKVRNKVAFHYDPKEIYRGHRTFFSSGSHGSERSFISRGIGVKDTRLFFADAAVKGYVDSQMESDEKAILYKTLRLLLDSSILFKIVQNFIQKRRFTFRKETEEA